ncbi:MAG: RsmE family RNA methyltransferase, partial [Firmicutes bacterium]|nr:RsmE family RNA methyltransferase [Bacillota bacterium]
IASEAAKQCGRGKLPRVGMPLSFDEMKGEMKSCDVTFACYEAETQHSVKQLLKRDFDSISFFIGPEGGLSPEECESLDSSCIPLVTLGTRILRAETAAATVLSMLAYEKEL